jgi:HEAT repeat protein
MHIHGRQFGVVLFLGLLGAWGAGCEEPKAAVTVDGPRKVPVDKLKGGPMPVREARQLAFRCIKDLPAANDEDRKLRSAFEERIIVLLAHPDPVQRSQAGRDLGELRRAQAIEALLLAAGDGEPDRAVRVDALRAIGWIGDSSCAMSVALRLNDPAVDVRIMAAKTLARLGNPQAAEALGKALKDPEPRVRASAVSALGWLRDPKTLDALTRALKDSDGQVRSSAAGALGLLGDKRAVPPLIDALKDTSSMVRYLAVSALGKLGDPQALPAVRPLVKDPDPAVRKAAQLATLKLQK